MNQCHSIRSRERPHERCPHYTKQNSNFCGVHDRCVSKIIFKTSASPVASTPVYLIQKWWKRQLLRLHGPAVFVRTLSNNVEDFATLEPCSTIPLQFFFSYTDADNFVYAFDIRSLMQLTENPYNRLPFSQHVSSHITRLLTHLQCRSVSTCYEIVKLPPEQQIKTEATTTFQKIDSLEFYTDVDWFLSLNPKKLKTLYHVVAEIFFNRAGLSREQRTAMIPSINTVFEHKASHIYKMQNKLELQRGLLKMMNGMLDSPSTRENSKLMALYILMGFTTVSGEAAVAFPFLRDAARGMGL